MPSYGVAVGLARASYIKKEVEKAFQGSAREDAFKFLALSAEGGENLHVMIGTFGALITSIILFNGPWIGAMVAGMVTSTLCVVLIRKRERARDELSRLTASNPVYWGPIQTQLEHIVASSGMNVVRDRAHAAPDYSMLPSLDRDTSAAVRVTAEVQRQKATPQHVLPPHSHE